MRFLCMHKTSPEDETEAPPSQELIENMGALIGELARAGLFLNGDGLRSSAHRYRLTRRGGDWSVRRGPFGGSNELPAGLATIKVATWDEALDWGRRFGDAVGAQELELGLATEEWDLGFGTKPADAPLRVMIQHKATKDTEAGRPLPPDRRAALTALLDEMREADVLLYRETLAPSSRAQRLIYRNNRRTILDGPFAESKELIGGFCMLELPSLDDVLAFCDRFVAVLGGTCELDLRTAEDA